MRRSYLSYRAGNNHKDYPGVLPGTQSKILHWAILALMESDYGKSYRLKRQRIYQSSFDDNNDCATFRVCNLIATVH